MNRSIGETIKNILNVEKDIIDSSEKTKKTSVKENLFEKYMNAAKNGTLSSELADKRYSDNTKARTIHQSNANGCVFNEFVRNIDRASLEEMKKIGALDISRIECGPGFELAISDGLKNGSGLINELLSEIIKGSPVGYELIKFDNEELEIIKELEGARDEFLKYGRITPVSSMRANAKLISDKLLNNAKYSIDFKYLLEKYSSESVKIKKITNIYKSFYLGCSLALSSENIKDYGDLKKTIKITSEKIKERVKYKNLNSIADAGLDLLPDYDSKKGALSRKIRAGGDVSETFIIIDLTRADSYGSILLNSVINNHKEIVDFVINDNNIGDLAISIYTYDESQSSTDLTKNNLMAGRVYLEIINAISSKNDEDIKELADNTLKTYGRYHHRGTTEKIDWERLIVMPLKINICRDLIFLNIDILSIDDLKKGTNRVLTGIDATDKRKLLELVLSGKLLSWRGADGKSFGHLVTESLEERKCTAILKEMYLAGGDWTGVIDNKGRTPLDMIKSDSLRATLSSAVMTAEVKKDNMNKITTTKPKSRVI